MGTKRRLKHGRKQKPGTTTSTAATATDTKAPSAVTPHVAEGTKAPAAGTTPHVTAGPTAAPSDSVLRTPLHVQGRFIVDSIGEKVHLHCVTWAGAEQQDGVVGGLQFQPVEAIAHWIKEQGFNCIRLPWSVWMVRTNPTITEKALLTANPALVGKPALYIFDAVVHASRRQGLMVILDNHMSDGDWCCSETDENGLWYNDRWPETAWLQAHRDLAKRYQNVPVVIGMELRNELRASVINGKRLVPTWGTGDKATDWKMAAAEATEALRTYAKHWIVFVDGLHFSSDFNAILGDPLLKKNLVYAPHDYSWFHEETTTEACVKYGPLRPSWTSLFKGTNRPHAVWLSEFGVYHDFSQMAGHNYTTWFQLITEFIVDHDLDWAYWRLDGTESRGQGRHFGAEEPYAILNGTWNGPAGNGQLLKSLQGLMDGQPYVDPGCHLPRPDYRDKNLFILGGVALLMLLACLLRQCASKVCTNTDARHVRLGDAEEEEDEDEENGKYSTKPQVIGAAVEDMTHFEIGDAEDGEGDGEAHSDDDDERFWRGR